MTAAKTPTLLFTDIEGSTALFERVGPVFTRALELHHAILQRAITGHGGRIIRDTGDGLIAAFEQPQAAVAAAVAAQQALWTAEWPDETGPLRVRMGIHRGEAELRNGDYHGLTMHHAARVMSSAHGRQILCSAPVIEALDEQVAAKTRDLGLYRLKGIQQPVRLFEIVHGNEYPRLPPLTVPAAFTHSLPTPPTKYFGRETEIEELTQLLSPGAAVEQRPRSGKLLTLLGAGGTGKTRLAIEVARRLLPAYSHAVWFVPLAELRQPELFMDHLCKAIGLDADPQKATFAQVVEYLGAQPSLLLLDNLEQLLPAVASPIDRLLASVPSLCCLVTSRVRLHLSREHQYTVAPLPSLVRTASREELLACPSAALFVDRAQAVRRKFAVNGSNADDIARLVHALEGIPLAIELAAARIAVLSPGQILQRMNRQLELLTGGPADAPERHRALRATIEWSFSLLTQELQRSFSRLSVFRGGWDLEAAESVVFADETGQDTINALEELRSKSLIQEIEGTTTVRYAMLESIREYASELLAKSPDGESIMRQHQRYFLRLGSDRAGKDEAAAFSRITAEYDNIRAVLESDAPASDRAKLACSLRPYWMTRGMLLEGRRWIRGLREEELPPSSRAFLACAEGILDWKGADLKQASVNLNEALRSLREMGEQFNVAGILNNLGILSDSQGDTDAAERYYTEALSIYRHAEDRSHIAAVLSNLGVIEMRRKRFQEAGSALKEALTLQQDLGEQWSCANTLHNLAELHMHLGDWTAARRHLHASLKLRAVLGARDVASTAFGTLAEIAMAEGDAELAVLLLAAAEHECDVAEIQPAQADRDKWRTDFHALSSDLDPVRVAALRQLAQRIEPEAALADDGGWSPEIQRLIGREPSIASS